MKKTCRECGELKEHKGRGLCGKCYSKKHRLENIEKIEAREKKYRLENREKIREYSRKYRLENPEKRKACQRKYRLENPEKNKEYKLKNKEKIKISGKKYYIENKDKIKTCCKNYYLENKEKWREQRLRRRGYGRVKKGIVDRLINENILKYGVITCEQCKEFCKNDYHIDHIIPVSRDGSNEYDNLQILCAHCNCSKHTDIVDYRKDAENNQMFLK